MGFPTNNEPEVTVAPPEDTFVPENADVNKADLGAKPEFGATRTLDVKQNASVNAATNPNTDHIVEVQDHTMLPDHYYDYKIHCKTCGWEARTNLGTTTLKGAEEIAADHVERKRNNFFKRK